MTEKNKMDAEMKIRCYLEEKGLLKKQADEVGMSMSDYVRSLIFSNEKVILLSEGAEIAKALFLIHTDIECLRNSGDIPEKLLEALIAALNCVSTEIRKLTEKLTDIHDNHEENTENE